MWIGQYNHRSKVLQKKTIPESIYIHKGIINTFYNWLIVVKYTDKPVKFLDMRASID